MEASQLVGGCCGGLAPLNGGTGGAGSITLRENINILKI
jgi:hypothetical protein